MSNEEVVDLMNDLERVNLALREKHESYDRVVAVNKEQQKRLIGADLLRMRVDEMEKSVGKGTLFDADDARMMKLVLQVHEFMAQVDVERIADDHVKQLASMIKSKAAHWNAEHTKVAAKPLTVVKP